jgi:hypothetical protein
MPLTQPSALVLNRTPLLARRLCTPLNALHARLLSGHVPSAAG